MTAPIEGYRTRRWNWPDTRGEKNPAARLTVERVAEMRRRHAAGESVAALARAYGITKSHASKVIRGIAWTPTQADR